MFLVFHIDVNNTVEFESIVLTIGNNVGSNTLLNPVFISVPKLKFS